MLTDAKLGVLIMELEKLHPGLVEACRRRAESETHIAGAVRLRGPRIEPQVREELLAANDWYARVSVAAKCIRPAKVKRK